MWIVDQVTLRADQRAALERDVLGFNFLQDVVRWGFSQTPPRDVADVVVQDEFSHDVVMGWRDSLFLVFDTT